MAKAKPTLAHTILKMSEYKFDTSKYIILHSSIRRDSTTGKLTNEKAGPRAAKAKLKK